VRQTHRARAPATPAGATLRGRRSHGRRAPAPAVSVLVVVLMGCTNSMQTGSSAPPPGRLTLRVADAALAAGVPDMALRVDELILRDDPRNAPALLAKGDALYAMGHPDLARGAYRAAIAIDPSSVGALIGLGRTLVRTDPKAAEAAFLDAATRAPGNVTALSNLGIARDMQGRHEAAQTAYREALAAAPDTADVKLNLGLSLALSGKPAEAVAQLRPLVGQTGSTDVRRNDLAAALTLAGDQVEAGLVLRGEARSADPEAPPPAIQATETPLVAIASLALGHAAAAPDEAAVPVLDIRPAPVIPVLEVANPGAPIGSATVAAVAPHPLRAPAPVQVSAPGQVSAIMPPSHRQDIAPTKLGATAASVDRTAAHAVAAAPRRAARLVPDTATRSAPAPASIAPDLVAPVVVAPVVVAPVVVAPAAIGPAARSPPIPSDHAVDHFAQPAALDTEQLARAEWQRLQSRLGGLLDGRAPEIDPADVHERTFWRLRTGGSQTSTEQSAFCAQVRGPELGLGCW
jgi:Flp pilus assembly protein TadD